MARPRLAALPLAWWARAAVAVAAGVTVLLLLLLAVLAAPLVAAVAVGVAGRIRRPAALVDRARWAPATW